MQAQPKMRQDVVKSGNRDLVNVLVDCCFNCLNGNIKLNHRQKGKLRPHKHILRQLIEQRTGPANIRTKTKLLQRGGFLGTLLSVAVPALIGLLGAAK